MGIIAVRDSKSYCGMNHIVSKILEDLVKIREFHNCEGAVNVEISNLS